MGSRVTRAAATSTASLHLLTPSHSQEEEKNHSFFLPSFRCKKSFDSLSGGLCAPIRGERERPFRVEGQGGERQRGRRKRRKKNMRRRNKRSEYVDGRALGTRE